MYSDLAGLSLRGMIGHDQYRGRRGMTEEPAKSVEVTILMPCLNEAETVGTCIRKAWQFLSQANISGEILIADNGSTDGSQTIAEQAGVRVVPVADRGYGAALNRLAGLAMKRKPSVDFSGYWQRHSEASILCH